MYKNQYKYSTFQPSTNKKGLKEIKLIEIFI
jgi:hypothetical protein